MRTPSLFPAGIVAPKVESRKSSVKPSVVALLGQLPPLLSKPATPINVGGVATKFEMLAGTL